MLQRTCLVPGILDILGIVCGLASLALHVVGTSYPVWWVVHEQDERNEDWTFTYGIWVIRECKNNTCVTTSSEMHGDRAWLVGPAVLLVFAAVLLTLVPVLGCCHFRNPRHATSLRKLAVVLSGGAGAVIILAVLIFAKKKAGLRPSAAPETTDGDPGWALFLSSTGSLLAIMNAVLLGFSVSRYSHKYMEKHKTIFGINATELEIDVNALRRGELAQGKHINMTSQSTGSLVPMSRTTSHVNMLPAPSGYVKTDDDVKIDNDVNGDIFGIENHM